MKPKNNTFDDFIRDYEPYNSGKEWTKDDDHSLLEMWKNDMTPMLIARSLNRTLREVIVRLAELNTDENTAE